MSWDPYLDLRSGVLRNRLGITDAAELARAEAELTSYRLIELRTRPLPGSYDLPHLQAFHRYIFGDVYDWAGELRTVTLGASDGETIAWLHANGRIESQQTDGVETVFQVRLSDADWARLQSRQRA